jgi:hypothetical protein
MIHIRSSTKNVFLLENNGVPTQLVTDFNEPIISGSLCVDVFNGDLYILKGVTWTLFNSGTSGLIDISYTRTQPTKVTVGGLPQGTIPNYLTIQDLFDDILYPFTAPTISLSSSSLHEKGATVNKSMNYNITLNDGIISTKQILLNNIVETTLSSNTGTYNSTSNLTWSNSPTPMVLYYPHTFTFRVDFTNSSQLNSNILVEFAAPTYYGVLSIGSVNETNIKTLTKRIRKKSNDTNLNFNPTIQRYVYAYPSIYGDLFSIIDQNGFNVTASFTKSVLSFTLTDLTSENYNVYVSNSNTTQVNFKNSFNFN